MKECFVLYKKECAFFFQSVFFYIILGIYLFLLGWIFFNNIVFSRQDQNNVLTEQLIPSFVGNLNFLLMIFIPLISIRFLTEEKKQKTLSLLLLSYLSEGKIVLAKWFAGATISLLMIVLSSFMLYPFFQTGYIHWGTVLVAFLGSYLNALLFLSIGLCVSAFTDNMIVAAVVTFVCLFSLLLLGQAPLVVEEPWLAQLCGYLSVPFHFESFSRGFLRSFDFFYYASGIFFFLYLAKEKLISERW